MTGYHVILHARFDLERMEREAQADRGPRHVLYSIAQQLDATVHQPVDSAEVNRFDRIVGRVLASPQGWAQARRVVRQAQRDDVVLANDESAFVIGLLGRLHRRPLKVIMGVTWPDSPRLKLLGRVLGLKRVVTEFAANTESKAAVLRRVLNLPAERVFAEPEQTDLRFFRPGVGVPSNPRPLIYSAGREGRDYATLGAAIDSLNVDVLVCAVSPSTQDPNKMTVPDPMPANMRFEPLEWVPFRDTYQRADVVVVPVLDRPGSPGLTVIMEAMACRRPVITTRTVGYAGDLIDEGCVIGVPPGDAPALRKAIESVLGDRAAAEAMAARGYEVVCARHSSDRLVADRVARMRLLGGDPAPAEQPVAVR